MQKQLIHLTILNNTGRPLQYQDCGFDAGHLAEGSAWPSLIAPDATASITCTEGRAPGGCAGWVAYTLEGEPLRFAFASPAPEAAGPAHLHGPASMPGSNWATAVVSAPGSHVTQVSWDVHGGELGPIEPANIELKDVLDVFNRLATKGTRRYYKAGLGQPTTLAGLGRSHFKGIAAYAGKLIFTHTNIPLLGPPSPLDTNGRYLIADHLPVGASGTTTAYNTQHPSWRHPSSSQACGSFMAMGIQASEEGSGQSEIQLLDIRPTRQNKRPILLGSIARQGSINGVAMTKERGTGGRYLVAGVDGQDLRVYQSGSTSLLTDGQPTVAFRQILHVTDFPDSGAGLALVTQQGDGRIFLFALNADEGQPSYLTLYRLHIDRPVVTGAGPGEAVGARPGVVEFLGRKQMEIPGMSKVVESLEKFPVLGRLVADFGSNILNSSFRWGKGLAVTSESTLEVYASDRNCFPFSVLYPLLGKQEDFSLVVWSSPFPPAHLYLTKESKEEGDDGIWEFNAPDSAPTQLKKTQGYGFAGMAASGSNIFLTTQGRDDIWLFEPSLGTCHALVDPKQKNCFTGIVAVGDHLYLTHLDKRGIWRYTPRTRQLTTLAGSEAYDFWGITAMGTTLYVTRKGSNGVLAYSLQGDKLVECPHTMGCGFTGITASGHLLYLTTQGSDGIWRFDTVENELTQLPNTAGAGFSNVVAMNSVLYVTAQGADGVWAYDLPSGFLQRLAATGKAHFRSLCYLAPQDGTLS